MAVEIQILWGILIGLSVILVLQIIGAILDERGWKQAMARFEKDLRDHPPSTATTGRNVISGTGDRHGS